MILEDGFAALRRENADLKARCAQLQSDVSDLTALVVRFQGERERLVAPTRRLPSDPPAGET